MKWKLSAKDRLDFHHSVESGRAGSFPEQRQKVSLQVSLQRVGNFHRVELGKPRDFYFVFILFVSQKKTKQLAKQGILIIPSPRSFARLTNIEEITLSLCTSFFHR